MAAKGSKPPGKPSKPTEGRRSPAGSGGRARRKPHLNALQRHQRGRQIAAMRSRVLAGKLKPVAWKDIARELGMSESGAHDAWEQFKAAEATIIDDPLAVVDETIDVLTVVVHESLRTYEAADAGSSVRVQALRTAVDTAVTRLSVMRAAGRAPRSLAGPSLAQELQTVFRRFAELLREHHVGDDVLRAFIDLAEEQMGLATISGHARELPSAA